MNFNMTDMMYCKSFYKIILDDLRNNLAKKTF